MMWMLRALWLVVTQDLLKHSNNRRQNCCNFREHTNLHLSRVLSIQSWGVCCFLKVARTVAQHWGWETKSSVWVFKMPKLAQILEQSSGTRQVSLCVSVSVFLFWSLYKTNSDTLAVVFTTFWRHLWSITGQTHSSMESISGVNSHWKGSWWWSCSFESISA